MSKGWLESDLPTDHQGEQPDEHLRLRPFVTFVYPERLRCELTQAELQVGRSRSAGLTLRGQRVSRTHCRFTLQQEVARLHDLGSRNGTFVNGQPAEATELHSHDVVRIGEWVGLFSWEPPDADGAVWEVSPGFLAGPVLREVLGRAEAIAKTDLPLLLSGESGTGKERVAQFVHEKSGRRGSFVALNCAAIPETLAESTLFGHQRGAFTGADKNHLGAFREAHSGTLLLDEISDLPMSVQSKLLRVLEDGKVTPLGDSRSYDVDVRVIAAGQEKLRSLVLRDRFRGDLFARLNGLELTVPALRERREEIFDLFAAFFQEFTKRLRPLFAPELVERLLTHRWPFNVRELVQCAHRTAALHGHLRELGVDHVELDEDAVSDSEAAPSDDWVSVDDLREASRSQQRAALQDALKQSGGNLTQAARLLGISRQRAYRLLQGSQDGSTPDGT